MRSDIDTAALDLDHADPFETTNMKNDQRILILTELDRVLVWISKDSRWQGEEHPVMPNGKKYLHVRPGAKDLVSFLLQEGSRFSFAVVSSLGHWNC